MAKKLAPTSVKSLILGARETEKASAGRARHPGPSGSPIGPVYTFKVKPFANKIQIRQELFERYQIKPVKIRIINLPAKRIFYRGRPGRRPGLKKAMVYLKPGETLKNQS